MKKRVQLVAVFLLSWFFSTGQFLGWDDTLTIQYKYASYLGKGESFLPHQMVISRYSWLGYQTDILKYEYAPGNPKPYLYYQEIYEYGSNDSIKSIICKLVPPGGNRFKTIERRDYIYNANNLLIQVKSVKYAVDENQRKQNKLYRGKRLSDTSGWTSASATWFYYDDQKRLIKKAEYEEVGDKEPRSVWLYNYGNDFPDVNDYFKGRSDTRVVYNHLYKRGRLVAFREETYSDNSIGIETEEYFYNMQGQVDKVLMSEKIMTRKKDDALFKQDGRETPNERNDYIYKKGLLSEIKIECRESYTKTKYRRSFADGMAAIGSVRVSTSTTRAGDYERTTTTTSYQAPPPAEKGKEIKKTKHKWQSKYSEVYMYDNKGMLVQKKQNYQHTDTYIYDSNGRVKMLTHNYFPSKYYEKGVLSGNEVRLVYAYGR